jgi:glucokinase
MTLYDPSLFLAADIGGTSIKIGMVEQRRNSFALLCRREIPLKNPHRIQPTLNDLLAGWRKIINGHAIDGISIALPKLVDPATGLVAGKNDKLDDLIDIDLREWTRKHFDAPVVLENDARAALIGEWQAGAGQGCRDLLMITLGTGFGSAAVIENRVLRGGHGHAGVLGGHISLEISGQPVDWEDAGCVETLASTVHLKTLVQQVILWTQLQGPLANLATPTYRDVFDLARAADPLALHVRNWSYRVWAVGVHNLVLAYGSSRVIIGGGVAAGADGLCAYVENYINRQKWITWGPVAVQPASLGNNAALVGGAYVLHEFYPPSPPT